MYICVCLGADGADTALVLQRRSSVDLSAGMASGGDEAMAAAAVDGPKKMAKPGRRNSVEVRLCFRLQFSSCVLRFVCIWVRMVLTQPWCYSVELQWICLRVWRAGGMR